MDIDELERRTHEQLRELQEEYRKRAEPLNKILMDIHMARPMKPLIIPADHFAKTASDEMLDESSKYWGVSVLEDPEYKRAQQDLNKLGLAMVEAIPLLPF